MLRLPYKCYNVDLSTSISLTFVSPLYIQIRDFIPALLTYPYFSSSPFYTMIFGWCLTFSWAFPLTRLFEDDVTSTPFNFSFCYGDAPPFSFWFFSFWHTFYSLLFVSRSISGHFWPDWWSKYTCISGIGKHSFFPFSPNLFSSSMRFLYNVGILFSLWHTPRFRFWFSYPNRCINEFTFWNNAMIVNY